MQDITRDNASSTADAQPKARWEKDRDGLSPASLSSFENDEPTEEERNTLRLVPDKLPWAAFLVALIELCERFTYYGVSGPFQNYIQNQYKDPNGLPGAIGRYDPFSMATTLKI